MKTNNTQALSIGPTDIILNRNLYKDAVLPENKFITASEIPLGGVQDKIEKTTIIDGIPYTGRVSITNEGNVKMESGSTVNEFLD